MFSSDMVFMGLRWIRHSYMLVFCSMASLVYVTQQWGMALPLWVNNYLNDFLCMPIVLFICRYAVRRFKANNEIRLSLPLILMVTLYYAFYFEYYVPQVNPRYTADAIDIALYFSGALFFYVVEKEYRDLI